MTSFHPSSFLWPRFVGEFTLGDFKPALAFPGDSKGTPKVSLQNMKNPIYILNTTFVININIVNKKFHREDFTYNPEPISKYSVPLHTIILLFLFVRHQLCYEQDILSTGKYSHHVIGLTVSWLLTFFRCCFSCSFLFLVAKSEQWQVEVFRNHQDHQFLRKTTQLKIKQTH